MTRSREIEAPPGPHDRLAPAQRAGGGGGLGERARAEGREREREDEKRWGRFSLIC